MTERWPPPLDPKTLRGALERARSQTRAPGWRLGALIALTWALSLSPWLAMLHSSWWGLLWALPGGLGALLSALLLHECAHLSLPLPRTLQRVMGVVQGALWLSPYSSYRQGHLAHHRYLDSSAGYDPTASPQQARSPSRLLDLILWVRVIPALYWGGVWGPYLIYALRPTTPQDAAKARGQKLKWSLSLLASGLLIVALPYLIAADYKVFLACWGLSFWSGSLLYEHLFTMHQHLGLQAGPERKVRYTLSEQLNSSRSTTMPCAWLVYHFNLHKEHHLAPGLPFYMLPTLHDALKQARPDIYRFTDPNLGAAWRRRAKRSHEQLSPRPGDATDDEPAPLA